MSSCEKQILQPTSKASGPTMATTMPIQLNLQPQPPPFPKLGSGKRGAQGPLPIITSSDEEDSDHHESNLESLPSPLSSPRSRSSRCDSPTNANFACEHDHDYENVASPNSSTASGPVYVRPPGFQHHAQEIGKEKIKKKKTTALNLSLKEGLKKREPTPPKVRPKRDPLPMKLRALPQSFWQQPNVPHQVSPGNMFPILPPLWNKDTEEDVTDVRPVTPPCDQDKERKQGRIPERRVTVADTDLLFKLFDGVGEEKKMSSQMKRGRQRKILHKSNTKGLLSGNDPYLVDAMTDKLFPQLSLENGGRQAGNTSLQLITLNQGDKTVTLPSLSVEQNYSQMLSELVMHI